MIDVLSHSLAALLVVVVQFEAFGDVFIERGVHVPTDTVQAVVLVRIDLQLKHYVVQVQLLYVEHRVLQMHVV